MSGKHKNKAPMNKEDDFEEDWCFVCKDGGNIRMCDFPKCSKGYHHRCLRKNESFLENEKTWHCAWHKCFRCRKSSDIRCYTCKHASCHSCLPTANILRVRESYGFCKDCLYLASLFEEKKEYNSDGDRLDFTDLETEEGLFMEYYKIIKNNEKFKWSDVNAAKETAAAKKNSLSETDSEDSTQEKEDQMSDSSDTDDEVSKRQKRRKSSCRKKPTRSNKKKLIGQPSRSLKEFLKAIGESATEKRSQDDVTAIVHDYARKNKLLRTVKTEVIMCDAQLQSLFREKTIKRSKISDYLGAHFVEDKNESKVDDVGCGLEDSVKTGTLKSCKRQRKMGVKKNTHEKEAEKNVVPIESRFASIVVENMRLIYLKRSVLKEMLKEPQLFEEKVTGCFVRFKQSKSYYLVQVKGVKVFSTDETETVLLLSAEPKEIQISLLSDDDFAENEFEVLKGKVVAGEIERPTVEYLQQKARSLHKDMINVMIHKELRVLPNRINHAREKGWRPLLAELRERLKVLESGTEHTRLLQNLPTVIPDLSEPAAPNCNSGGKKSDEEKNKSEEIVHSGIDSEKREQPIAKAQEVCTPEFDGVDVIDVMTEDESGSGDDSPVPAMANPEHEVWRFKGPDGERNKSPLYILRQWFEGTSSSYKSKFVVWKEDETEEDAIPLPKVLGTIRGRR